MAYEVKYHKVVIKFLQKQNKDFVKRTLDAFDEIAQNPTESNQDIKPLSGSPKNHYRLRIGKFRFLYEVTGKSGSKIEVLGIIHIRLNPLALFLQDPDSLVLYRKQAAGKTTNRGLVHQNLLYPNICYNHKKTK